jgi:hypothetical protein
MGELRRRIAESQRIATLMGIPALAPTLTTRAIDLLKDFQECLVSSRQSTDTDPGAMIQLKKDLDILSARISTLYSAVHNNVAVRQDGVETQITDMNEAHTVLETAVRHELQNIWGYVKDDSGLEDCLL